LSAYHPLPAIVACREEMVFGIKFALQGWLEAIKTELAQDGVHVMWVCPGFDINIRHAALDQDLPRVKAQWTKVL
jgi:NAD(P)-dependent dehydrogenase (short-subunit alcohol dehydrogenase family)